MSATELDTGEIDRIIDAMRTLSTRGDVAEDFDAACGYFTPEQISKVASVEADRIREYLVEFTNDHGFCRRGDRWALGRTMLLCWVQAVKPNPALD